MSQELNSLLLFARGNKLRKVCSYINKKESLGLYNDINGGCDRCELQILEENSSRICLKLGRVETVAQPGVAFLVIIITSERTLFFLF